MSGRRLPRRINVFGNLEGAVRRGREGREKEGIDCVQSDVPAFGIVVGWKAAALEAGVWVETVPEGRRRFMVVWRKEGVRAARLPKEKREAKGTGKLVIVTWERITSDWKATIIGLVTEQKESSTGLLGIYYFYYLCCTWLFLFLLFLVLTSAVGGRRCDSYLSFFYHMFFFSC